MTEVLLDINQPIPVDGASATFGAVLVAVGVFHLVRRVPAVAPSERVSPAAARAITGAGRFGRVLVALLWITVGGGGAAWFTIAPHVRAARLRHGAMSALAVTSTGTVADVRDDPGHRALSWTLVTPDGTRAYAYSESALGTGLKAYDRLRGAVREGRELRVVTVEGVLVRIEAR